jgi:hypothetical protein
LVVVDDKGQTPRCREAHLMERATIESFAESVVRWAMSRPDVAAIGMNGSWARDAGTPDSDLDLLVIVDDPAPYTKNTQWASTFGEPRRLDREDWGAVQSVRVFYVDGSEVEFGLCRPSWASTDPVDPGTAQVIRDGTKILHDPRGLLGRLKSAVQ